MVLTNDNPLRSGFEFFYNITNAFVDTLIYPSISKDYIENRNKTMDYVKNIDKKFIKNNFSNLEENWKELISVVSLRSSSHRFDLFHFFTFIRLSHLTFILI
jgi:hypothetical protein